jgi:DNA-directed RNA polymerase subunit RPC12/RpoP
MDYTKAIGNVNELKCITKFISMGFNCSIPYGDAAKYDFIVDVNGKLLRMQCKSSSNVRLKSGERDLDAFQFSCVCSTTNTKETIRHRYTEDDIDYFCTSFLDQVYIVPVNECSTSKTLRLAPPKSGALTYNRAEDYLVENLIKEYSEEYLDSKERYEEAKQLQFKEKYYCPDCGKEVHEKGVRCPECSAKHSRKVERPSREELKGLIRNLSFLKIGQMFGVTDNSVRKWCDAYKLPRTKTEINEIDDENWKDI